MHLKTMILIMSVVVLLSDAKAIVPSPCAAVATKSLMARVAAVPSEVAVKEFVRAGMQEVRPHNLTSIERAKVEAALASLPPLSREVLEKRLHRLAFVDGIPGEGTGLTSEFAKTGLYDITLRASVIDESLSTFLTTKERRAFATNGSQMSITIHATGTDALTYVLLHESSHIVDRSKNVTASPRSRFTAGIWARSSVLVPQLAASPAASTIFRGGYQIPIVNAPAVYDSLSLSPFVSLYATASQSEDFAELVAWHEILLQHQGDLVVEIDDANGSVLKDYRPLTFSKVQERFAYLDELLVSCGRINPPAVRGSKE
jgi:hypothetical protein